MSMNLHAYIDVCVLIHTNMCIDMVCRLTQLFHRMLIDPFGSLEIQSQTKKKKRAEKVYNQYIKPGAPEEINMSMCVFGSPLSGLRITLSFFSFSIWHACIYWFGLRLSLLTLCTLLQPKRRGQLLKRT